MTASRDAAAIPYALSYRSLATVLDQGGSSSCEGHGWAQALYIRGQLSKTLNVMPSPAFLYACALQYDAGVASASLDAPRPVLEDTGTYGRTVGFILKSRGIVAEADYPLANLINPATGHVRYPPLDVLAKAGDALATEVAWLPDSLDVATEICRALAAQFPLSFGMHISKDYFDLAPGSIYMGPNPAKGLPDIGGHCQCIIGYNLEERWVEVAGSWGREFCDGGFARVSFDALNNSEICSEFAAVTLTPQEIE